MSTAHHLRYDVFTDRAYAGNPLAVLLDPPALTGAQRQAIAAEFNLSETVFAWTRDDGDGWDVRIHTPASELPFAGHPTVGLALALVDAGLAIDRVVLHEPVGVVPVDVVDGVATLTTPAPPAPVASDDPGEVAAALGLTMADLHPSLGPRAWSAGVPYTIVPVRDLDVLARAAIDVAEWSTTLALGAAPATYVVAPLDGIDGQRWRARMFAPEIGIVEDPATGSAAAALVGFLAGRVGPARQRDGWIVEQGVEMGRPSELRLGIALSDRGELVGATVGGRAVQVGEGSLVLPSA